MAGEGSSVEKSHIAPTIGPTIKTPPDSAAERYAQFRQDLKDIADDLKLKLGKIFTESLSEDGTYALFALGKIWENERDKYSDWGIPFEDIVKKEYARVDSSSLEIFMDLRNKLDHGLDELDKVKLVIKLPNSRIKLQRSGENAYNLLQVMISLRRV